MTNLYHAHCDCNRVEVEMKDEPRVHAFCHCEDCRELLQVPYHSVLAWESDQLKITKGQDEVIEFQHPTKRMKRIFCKHCGDVIYNTNAIGWKIVSQLFFKKVTIISCRWILSRVLIFSMIDGLLILMIT